MSGSLVGGIVGGVIGFAFGAPQIGWMIGSTLGGVLDRPSPAPDRTDLRPQASEYGRPIPIVYSKMTVGPNIIWAMDLIKLVEGDDGGKGGGGPATGPVYAANFAALICESDGDHSLGRIWAGPEKRLVYDNATGQAESGIVTFHNGAADQMPDALMEAYFGAGNVPAYRGFAYIVWEGFDVSAHDGNRLPFLTIEIGALGTSESGGSEGPGDAPDNLGIAFFDRAIDAGDSIIFTYHGTYSGFVKRRKVGMSMVHHRLFVDWSPYSYYFYDAANDRLVTMGANVHGFDGYLYRTYDIAAGTVTQRSAGITLGSDVAVGACMANDAYVFVCNKTGGGTIIYTVSPSTNSMTTWQTYDIGDTATVVRVIGANPSYPWLWAVMSDGMVRRFDIDGSSGASVAIGTAPPGWGSGDDLSAAYDPLRNNLWMFRQEGATIHYAGFSSIARIAANSYASLFNRAYSWVFTPEGMFIIGNRWLGIDHFVDVNPDLGLPVETDGAYVGTANLMVAIYNDFTHQIVAARDGGQYSVSTPGDIPSTLPPASGYLGGADPGNGSGSGSGTLNYQKLGEVVTDLSLRAGFTEDQIDVTELTDQVDGYQLANQVATAEAVRTLLPVYYFDAVEDQGVVRFVKRGGEIVVEIPDEDLGAAPSDQLEPASMLDTTRGNDDDLPGTLSVNYVLEATKYSPATKYSRRLIGHSRDEARIDLAVVLTDQKAQEVAQVNLHNRWVERISYRFTLGRKYSYLMPTDVVEIQGWTMRITKMTFKAAGYWECEAVREDFDTYTPNVIVTETPPPDEHVAQQSLTLLELM